ncbi:hypothetical protein [Streptomyces palmae]|uniref:LPXTG cell wall anchor domain-containing protein n=1 Tax=Streptomyces palmae TaxID=1701085 RepID=A0A4Z0GC36_9ACTN|nr:hypothetical protein [Streptomyces palmae]TGA92128.1 hypothetical protein E4099_27925 [Streptomyces palmae]
MSTSVPPTLFGARPGAAVLAALACSGAALLAAPTTAAAADDQGDVTVRSVGTPISTARDESRVCRFYLAGAEFTSVREITWAIVPKGRSAQESGLSGGINLTKGLGRTEDLALPDGVYKLTWNVEGGGSAGKHKVFTVDCAGGAKSTPIAGRPLAGTHQVERTEKDQAGRQAEEDQGAVEHPAARRDRTQTADDRPEESADGGMEAQVIPGADGPETAGTDRSAGARADAGTETRTRPGDQAREPGGQERAVARAEAPPRGPVGAGGGGVAAGEGGAQGPSAAVVAGTLAAGAAGATGLFLVRRARRRPHGTL